MKEDRSDTPTDSTPTDRAPTDRAPTDKGPIDYTREGMTVVDAAGTEIGSVDLVKVGDPEAVTTKGQETTATQETALGTVPGVAAGAGPLGSASGAGGPMGPVPGMISETTEPDVPPALSARLLRIGFVKVDSKGLFRSDVYVAADQVDRVEDDTVYLNTVKDDLITQ